MAEPTLFDPQPEQRAATAAAKELRQTTQAEARSMTVDGNRLTHRSGEPFYCFAYTGNGQERHECAVSNDLCQARITARTAEKFEMASACKESEGVYCFGWVEGETSNSQCYETEPDCTELSAEISARVGKENASACQHFDRTHQTY